MVNYLDFKLPTILPTQQGVVNNNVDASKTMMLSNAVNNNPIRSQLVIRSSRALSRFILRRTSLMASKHKNIPTAILKEIITTKAEHQRNIGLLISRVY